MTALPPVAIAAAQGLRFTTTSALPSLAEAFADADARHLPWLVLAVRDRSRLPGLAGVCVMGYTRAQYRVDDPDLLQEVLQDARRVARLSPPGPVLVECDPCCLPGLAPT